MKYYIRTLIIFLCLTFVISLPIASATLPLKDKIIALDIGHGAEDPGTVYTDVYEKDINLAIGQKLKKELINKGATVVMTRDGDYDLSKPNAKRRKKSDFDNRIKVINNSHANMYISIHLNYLPQQEYSGPQVFYNNVKTINKQMANTIQETFNKALNTDRKIKKIPDSTYMYDKISVPGILIECGFLSNATERKNLQTDEYQQKLAEEITKGIINAL